MSRPAAPAALPRRLRPPLATALGLAATLAAPATLADPGPLRVAVRQCPGARIDPRALVRLLRVEFAGAGVDVVERDGEGPRLRIFVVDCGRARWSYTVHLDDGDREATLDVDLADVPAPQRARSLALAVAEFARPLAAPPPRPERPSRASPAPRAPAAVPPRRMRTDARRPPPSAGTPAPRWFVGAALEAAGWPGDVAVRGGRVGFGWRWRPLGAAWLYLGADARAHGATRGDALGAATFVAAELALGPRVAWHRRAGSLGVGVHVAAGAACAAGTASGAGVDARSGCGLTVTAGGEVRASARLAGDVALWSSAGLAWRVAGVDARALMPGEERSVGRLAGASLAVAVGVAWEAP